MGQQQSITTADANTVGSYRLSVSLGTKLVVSVLAVLLVVISFLSLSTIFLFREDKRAYIYQSQSTSAVLAGREFANMTRHALDTLRVSLAAIDPASSDSVRQSIALQTIVKNQSEALLISIHRVDTSGANATPLARAAKTEELAALQLEAAQLELDPARIKPVLPELLSNSYAYVNLSELGGAPLLAILFADTQLKSNPAGMPVAMAVVSLKEFGRELAGLSLTIATQAGSVLFDSDPARQFTGKSIVEDPLFAHARSSKVANGAHEYESEETRYLGSFVNPGLNLIVISRTEWTKAMKATYSLIETVIIFAMAAVGAAGIFTILFSKTLTAPLKRLYEGTRAVAQGNFNLELDVRSRDEIGALTGSFNVMSRKISELIQEQVQEQVRKAHLENELAIASTVQQNLIPASVYRDEYSLIHSHYQSASECGGDWWGFFRVGNKLALMISDATGHGLPSALITASARSCASVLHKLAQDDPEFSFSPSAMLSYANRVVFEASGGKIMMTFFVGVIDFDSDTLTYASAGHNPPWLFKKRETGYQLKSMTAVGMRLGEMADNHAFEEKTVPLHAEDVLFLYTDGLMEGKNADGEMYGKKRVRQIIESQLTNGPEPIVTTLMKEFMAYNGTKPLDDDVTLAVALLLPKKPGGSNAAQT